jgi:hypothetical protein
LASEVLDDATLRALPRPLRDAELLRQVRALDALHEREGTLGKGQGSWTLKVHYDDQGRPCKAWITASTEYPLEVTFDAEG